MLSATQTAAAAARGLHTLTTRVVALSAARLPTTRSTAVRSAARISLPTQQCPTAFLQARSSVSARVLSTHAHHAASHGPTVLVCGGNGALGQAMILAFKNAGWKTICMDYKPNPASDVNITLSAERDWKANNEFVEEELHKVAKARDSKSKKQPVSVAIHCAGSWLGGGAESLLSTVDPMLDINLKSAISTAHVASRFLDETGAGLLMLTGAAAAANQTPTPGMLAYGMSKAATHHLATSLAHREAGLKNATVVCMLPTMIDTPSNRAMSSNPADYESWTPPVEFASLALSFAQQLQPAAHRTKPLVEHAHAPLQSGGFYVFDTSKGKTSIRLLPPVVVPEPII